MRQKRLSAQLGFTLIEMMVTLFVLAVVLGIAIPNLTNQVRDNRSMGFGDEFANAVSYTRSEAVKRGELVTLCASNDAGTDCGNDWLNGWIAVVDSADEGDGSVTVEEVIRYWDPYGGDFTLTVERGSAVDFIRFNPRGGLANNSDQPLEASAKYSSCTSNSAKEIRVTLAGSVRARRADC